MDQTYANIIVELETAAQILLAPPNLVTSDQRHAAESVFLEFRKRSSPFQLCKQILETSKVDYVLFESAVLIKDGLIREWSQLSKDDVKMLRTYLLQYVINNPTLSGYVRERIVQVMAIIIKRQSVEDLGEDRRVVLAEVQERLIAQGNMQMQMVGCSILAAMMQEYATTVKSSDVGLAWEVHFKAKKQFELTDLKSIFEFCLKALEELSSRIGSGMSPEMNNLVLRLCTLAEAVLSWSFISVHLPKKLITVFEADQNPSLRPGTSWKDTILAPRVLQLFFQLHLKIRTDSELSHHTLNCLIQLSSLNGSVLPRKETRTEYLSNYIQEFLTMIQRLKETGSIQPMEALGCSNIVRKLMLFFPPNILITVRQDLLEGYLKEITQLTCHFMNASAQKNSLDDDASLYTEAFEHMLEAWVSILHESQSFPTEYCKQSAIEIFNTYLQCHLSPPDGIRGLNGSSDDDDDIDESEEIDRIRFKEPLAIIGALGREAPSHSINILCQLIEGRLSRLHGQIQRLISQGNRFIDKALSDLYEDLHWLILVAGNVLTMDTDGEAALIPSEIMRFSLSQSTQINLENSLRLLASPGQPTSEIPGFDSTDPVIRLISDVFRLAEVEKRAVEADFGTLLSPEVGSTVMWFLRRWVATYLSVPENFYSEISMALVAAFGQNTDGAKWTINFLLHKIISNLTGLSSEPGLMQETVLVLTALVDGKEKGREVLKSEGLLALVNMETNQQLNNLPPTAKRGLLKALVLVGSNCEDQNSREQYWTKALMPLIDKFNGIIRRDDLRRVYNDDKVRHSILTTLESFIGVIQGTQVTTVSRIFSILHPVLANLVELLGLYHNYSDIVELILEIFCAAAKRILCFLTVTDSRILYQRSVECIQMYANHNKGKKSIAKEAEEEQFRDLKLLMELLTNLLSKDFIDLAPSDPNGQDNDPGISAADVCLYGINIVMPLMSIELLRFPSLCLQYFRTVTWVAEIYPEKMCDLNPELHKNLIASLELGLTSLGLDNVYTLCCDFITVLSTFLFRSKKVEAPMFQSLRPFLKLILDLVLSHKINSDLIPNSSTTLYVLICSYPDTYNELVQYLIASQSDPTNQQRLKDAFNELTHAIPFTADRINRIRFRDAFEKFIAHVRGFLNVK